MTSTLAFAQASIDFGYSTSNQINELKDYATSESPDDDGIYWLRPNTYEVKTNSEVNKTNNIFSGSLGIGKDVTFNATATVDSRAGLHINGSIVQDDGTVNATGDSTTNVYTAYGIFIKNDGSYTLNGGTLNATGMSRSVAYSDMGLILYGGGDFIMNDGTLNAKITDSAYVAGSVYLNGGNFEMHGGILDAITTNSKGGAAGSITVDSGNFNMDGGVVTAKAINSGTGSSAGIELYDNGNFNIYSGDVTAEGTNTGAGKSFGIQLVRSRPYNIKSGDFTIENGTLKVSSSNSGSGEAYGIYLEDGNFDMKGGVVTAKGSNSGSGTSSSSSIGTGIELGSGNFTIKDGTLEVSSSNSGTGYYAFSNGIYLKSGNFNMEGGTVNVESDVENNNTAGYSSSLIGHGICLDSGDFNMKNGTLTVDATSSSLKTSHYSHSYGIRLKSGDFHLNGGTVNVTATTTGETSTYGYTYGIHLESNNNFIMTNGTLNTTGDATLNTGYGVHLETGSFTMSGGTINTIGKYSLSPGNGWGHGINLGYGNFTMSGGTVNATGTAYGSSILGGYASGIRLFMAGNFVMDGGKLIATGNGQTGYGVNLSKGKFIMNSGELTLDPGDGIGLALCLSYNNSINLNSGSLRTNIDFAGGTNNDQIVIGKMQINNPEKDYYDSDTGSIKINNSVRLLQPFLKNSIAFAKNSPERLIFGQATNEVVGTFAGDPQRTITLTYKADYEEDNVALIVTRDAYVSEVTGGSMKQIAKYIEENKDKFLNDKGNNQDLIDLYSSFDMLNSADLIPGEMRKTTPHTATRFLPLMVDQFDVAYAATMPRTRSYFGATDLLPIDKEWSFWITPEANYTTFDAESIEFDDATFFSKGATVGFGRHYAKDAIALSATGLWGDYESKNDFDSADTAFYAAILAYRFNPEAGQVWKEVGVGYAYGEYEQERGDRRHRKSSEVNPMLTRLSVSIGSDDYNGDNWRVTPVLGVDYTYAQQGGYREKGAAALSVDSVISHSLRPRIGVDASYNLNDMYSVNLGADYRYETLDNVVELNTVFAGYDELGSFTVQGENRSRHSGTLALGVTCKQSDSLSLDLAYGLKLADHITTQNIRGTVKWMF